MKNKEQCDQFAVEMAGRFEDFAKWAIEHWPSGGYPLLQSDFSESRKEVARLSLAVTPVERQEQRLFGAKFEGSPVPVGILIAPDGKRAFVANTNADVISVLDLEHSALSGRLRAGREPDGLGWCAR